MRKQIYSLAIISLIMMGCTNSTSVYTLNNKNLKLEKNNLKVNVTFTDPTVNYFSVPCANNSFILKDENKDYGYLFIESVKLDSTCGWNGSSSGHFLYNFKTNLKLEKIEVLENFEFANYNFQTLKINNDTYLNYISISSNNNDEFILDYKGKLYEDMMQLFKKDYISKFKNEKRFSEEYYNSLAVKNITNSYIICQEDERN